MEGTLTMTSKVRRATAESLGRLARTWTQRIAEAMLIGAANTVASITIANVESATDPISRNAEESSSPPNRPRPPTPCHTRSAARVPNSTRTATAQICDASFIGFVPSETGAPADGRRRQASRR